MVDLILLLFISISLPLAMMLLAVRGRTRMVFVFILCGLCACLVSANLNTVMLNWLGVTKFYMTVNITPIVEELSKLLPILVYAFAFKPERNDLLEGGIACGIGFSVLENAVILARAANTVTVLTALVRGIGAGMMHALCVCISAYGISLFRKRKKWFLPGTVALVICAMTFHSLYNILVQSTYYFLGVAVNVVIYAAVLVALRSKKGFCRTVQSRRKKPSA